MNLLLELELLSDTCFGGATAGWAGDVDLEPEADPLDPALPLLRGRTLKGLLGEELALILQALEPLGKGPWHDEAGCLLGEPGAHGRHGRLLFGDGRLPAALRDEVRLRLDAWRRKAKVGASTEREVRDALTLVRRQTRVDRDTGAPAPGSLRATRLVRSGLRFHCPLTVNGPLSAAGRALLAACTAGLRRAGLHRNEGWGRVRARLYDEAGQEVTAAWLALLQEPEREAEPPPAPAAEVGPASSPLQGPAVLTYRLTLTAPALLSTMGGDPSAVETLPFVSGAAVLGAAAGRWLAAHPAATGDAAADPEFAACFLDGTVRWLHAYPEGREGERMLPAPRSMETPKREQPPSLARDRAAGVQPEEQEEWQPLAEGSYVAFAQEEEGLELVLRRPRLRTSLHHQREREEGRPQGGSIFSYVALEAGESLIGHVLCELPALAPVVEALLAAAPLRLGRSRTASYGGQARVELLGWRPAAGWQELAMSARESAKEDEGELLAVTLLSDYLGRNERGTADPGALLGELAAALALPPELLQGAAAARFLGQRTVSGHVSAWRMPRPAHPALQAGSVLVLRGIRPALSLVEQLCWQGLGERRAEGFGRIGVRRGLTEELPLRLLEPPRQGRPEEGPAAAARAPGAEACLALLRARLLRNALHTAMLRQAELLAEGVGGVLAPAALLSRLRSQLRRVAGPAEVMQFLGELGLKKAGRSLDRCRCQGQTLREWLIAQLCASQGEEGRQPGWQKEEALLSALRRTGLPLELLDEAEQWALLQSFLDTLLERLRRRSIREEQRKARQQAAGEAR